MAWAMRITSSVLISQPGALITVRRNTGSSTSALSRRLSMPDPRGAPSATVAGVDTSLPTEAPVAALVIGDGPIEVRGPEVRPQRRRHPELGVGDLPQEEV